ncbi:MAG TPA: bifunctional nuclease domain-containing protein [Nitrososphaerales archaeon]|nr:bifunctional nuclease domain-containing protein [Nitrososphaerales archaeon]
MSPTSGHEDLEPTKLETVGFADENGVEGVAVLASISDGQRKLYIRAFSGEVATHIDRFLRGDKSSLPSIYNVVEDLAEKNGLHLASVQIYNSNDVLRGDIRLDSRNGQVILHGYRASDCVALAALYDAPILVQSSLLTPQSATA